MKLREIATGGLIFLAGCSQNLKLDEYTWNNSSLKAFYEETDKFTTDFEKEKQESWDSFAKKYSEALKSLSPRIDYNGDKKIDETEVRKFFYDLTGGRTIFSCPQD